MHMHMCMHTHVHMRMPMRMVMHVRMPMRMLMHVRMPMLMHVHMHVHVYTQPACRVSAVPASEKSRPLTRARWGEVATCTSPMPGNT